MFYPYYILSFIYYCSHHASRSSAALWFAHGIISLCLLYLFLFDELGGCARYNFASLIISDFIRWAEWFACDIISLCLLYLDFIRRAQPMERSSMGCTGSRPIKNDEHDSSCASTSLSCLSFLARLVAYAHYIPSPTLPQYKITLYKLLNIWLDFLYTKLIITLDLLIGIYVKMNS